MTNDATPKTTAAVEDDDASLVRASKSGDLDAFNDLVERYDRRLLRIAQGVTRNPEDAEEAVQEAFLKAYQRLEQFREDARFSTWLIRIVLNESLMKLRRQRTAKEVLIGANFEEGTAGLPVDLTDWVPNPEEVCRVSELRDILTRSLEDLRPALRVVFILRDLEELSIRETAEALGLNQSAVKTRLLRARLELRESLSEYFRAPERHPGTVPGAIANQGADATLNVANHVGQ